MLSGVDYFDLTESVDVTEYVKTLNNAKFITQCGLAPGMVSIIANNIASEFSHVKSIQIRVGALPMNTNNHMGYYRTWNTYRDWETDRKSTRLNSSHRL